MRLVPNILTLVQVALGFAQMAALLSRRADLVPALACAALLADFSAGRLAKKRSSQSGLGAELDALACLMAFALGPLVYLVEMGASSWVALAGAVAAALRLSRDNASSPDWPRYQGLPVTAFGLALALSAEAGLPSAGLNALALILSAAMLAPLTWKRIESRGLPLIFLGLAMVLGAAFSWARLGILFLVLAYALAGPLLPERAASRR